MRFLVPTLLLLVACGPAAEHQDNQPRADSGIPANEWSIIDAQDHRDVGSLVAALDDRPCLAVTDAAGAAHDATAAVLQLAGVLGVPVGLQVWGDEGERSGASDHVGLLASLLAQDRHDAASLVRVPVDLAVPDELVERAGQIVAWPDAPPA